MHVYVVSKLLQEVHVTYKLILRTCSGVFYYLYLVLYQLQVRVLHVHVPVCVLSLDRFIHSKLRSINAINMQRILQLINSFSE